MKKLVICLLMMVVAAMTASAQLSESQVNILKNAAEQGDAEAQGILGDYYFMSDDIKQAVNWWKKGAEKGDANSQYRMGLMYESGKGVAKDHKQARYWWEKAAAQDKDIAKQGLKMLEDSK